jgi:DNA-binding LacI/PurR family transcriptional regulator
MKAPRSAHERLADELRDGFKAVAPGDRVDSMATLAARHDVSVNTVRMAMVLLQREGWVRLRHGSGCYVSRPEPTPSQRHVAILSEYNLLLSPRGAAFYPHVMNELRLFLKAKGQSSRLYIGHVTTERPPPDTATCSEFLEDLALDRISGIAALATLPLFAWTDQARSKGIPIVGTGEDHYRFDGVVDPGFAGAIRGSLARLVAAGRRRPAFIGWDERSCAAFNATVAKVGLAPEPRWVRAGLTPLEPGAGWSDFREIWAAGGEKPDSIIFGDDVLFQDALPAVQTVGVRIPDELEVVVLANRGIPLPCAFPFARLDCDPAEFAREMGGMLLRLMAGEKLSCRQAIIPYRHVADDGAPGNAVAESRLADAGAR